VTTYSAKTRASSVIRFCGQLCLLAGLLVMSYGLFSLVMGVALILEGVAVLRARVWDGWRRWLPLALGIWVFVPLMPAMGLPFEAAEAAMAGWMLLFAALGWCLAVPHRRRAD